MEIQIQKIYPPKQAGWSASIKGADGNYYGVKEIIANGLSEGQTISADIRTKEVNGKVYRDIIKINDAGTAALFSPARATTPASPSAGKYGAQDDATAERIFVCGVVNAVAPKFYEAHKNITSEQLTALVQIARVTWSETFGKKAAS